MDPSWTLELLSDRGLSSSILLTVLLGLWLMLLLTETLGWVFVGVVVPGYLASIMVIQPTSALAITVEAFVTLALARVVAQGLSGSGAWSPFFGRDRFFLIVLISVWVRQLDQTLVLPWLDLVFRRQGWDLLDLNDRFSSIGLVLVPLTANLFWKQTLGRGLLQFSVIMGVTYALLRWVLLPYTNLSSASMMLLYEDSALNFVSNAKVYIVMVLTAMLASWANLRYGWDFGGILVAALLALLWWTPQKLGTTLAEAVVLYWIAKLLLKIPVIRRANLEGSRKIVAIFSLGFGLKCLVALSIGDAFVGVKITDFFAFGYLMSSILALRMLKDNSAMRVLGPVVVVSLVGLGLANLVGLEIQSWADRIDAQRERNESARIVSTRLLREELGVLAYASVAWPEASQRGNEEGYGHERVWRAMSRYLQSKDARDLQTIDRLARDSRMVWRELSGSKSLSSTYLLHPGETQEGVPRAGNLVMLRSGEHSGPVLVVHEVRRYPGLALRAWQECLDLDCPLLVLVQARRELELAWQEAPLFSALRRAHTLRHLVVDPKLGLGERRLVVGSNLSPARLEWSLVPLAKRLSLPKHDELVMVAPEGLAGIWMLRDREVALRVQEGSMLRFVQEEWALHRANHVQMRKRGRASNQPWSDTELRLLHDRIARVLVQGVGKEGLGIRDLKLAAHWARVLGLSVVQLPECGDWGCVALVSEQGAQSFLWILRLGSENAVDLQVPRASFEAGTMGFAARLWSAHGLRSLLVHTGAKDFDPSSMAGVDSVFHVIHQAMDPASRSVQEEWSEAQNLVLSIRGAKGSNLQEAAAARDEGAMDLVLGLGYALHKGTRIPSWLEQWVSPQGPLGFVSNTTIADSHPTLHRYAAQRHLQLSYSKTLGQKQGAVLWLSPWIRETFRPAAYSNWLVLHALYAGEEEPAWIDEIDFLGTEIKSGSDTTPTLKEVETLARFADPQDYARLVGSQESAQGLRLVRGELSGELFLAVGQGPEKGCTRALVRLRPALKGRVQMPDFPDAATARAWISRELLGQARTLWAGPCTQKGTP